MQRKIQSKAGIQDKSLSVVRGDVQNKVYDKIQLLAENRNIQNWKQRNSKLIKGEQRVHL